MSVTVGFFDRLARMVAANNSLLCVGIDPPSSVSDVRAFGRKLLEETKDVACVYKPNSAFFEARGAEGIATLKDLIADIHAAGLPAILDAKRGDIATSADGYATYAFDVLDADAITVNPLLGIDSLESFTGRTDRGIIVLCHTSNPGAMDLQELDAGGAPLYERIAALASRANRSGNVGLVVGATYPEVLRRVRNLAPEMWFLIPGVGSQGGDLEAAVEAGIMSDGSGAIVNVSRGIAAAGSPRTAAMEYREKINAVRQRVTSVQGDHTALRARRLGPLAFSIAVGLFDIGAVRFGEFTLKSGRKSPIYVDLRLLVSDARLLSLVARAMSVILDGITFQRIAAIPYGGLPIGTAVSLQMGKPLIYPRREVKEYGTKKAIEGTFASGEVAVILDDLVTTGGSKIEAAEPLTQAGLVIHDIVVLIDREQGGATELSERGYALHSVLTLSGMLDCLVAGRVTSELRDMVRTALGIG